MIWSRIERVVASTAEAYRKLVTRVGIAGVVFCYEAGPCGYDPYRILAGLGARCDVIAPSLIPRRAGDRVKTDRLDARNLARLHRGGELTAIRVPSPAEEAIRDLVRVREDIKEDRRSAIQRVKAFSLRRGIRAPAGWNTTHDRWARGLRFDQPAAQEAFDALVGAVQTRDASSAASTPRSTTGRHATHYESRWRGCEHCAASTRSRLRPSPLRCATSGPLPARRRSWASPEGVRISV